MKKIVLIAVFLLVLLLFSGCKAKEQNNMNKTNANTVTVINEVQDANIWILPQTQENLKTTLWGTPTLSDTKKLTSRQAPLCEPGDDGLYIFRMIDVEKFYYSANGIKLEKGYTVRIIGNDLNNIKLEVSDEKGELKETYDVFCARL